MARSAVMQAMDAIWKGAMAATGHSYTRLNGNMGSFVRNFIEIGMEFGPNDFKEMNAQYRGGYWFNEENWYSQAVNVNNIKACQSLEAYLDRPPFLYKGKRLCVGSEFVWEGKRTKITSLQLSSFVAVIHNYEDGTTKIAKRYTITRDMLKAKEKGEQPPPNPEWERIERLLRWLPKTSPRRDPFTCGGTKDRLRAWGTLKQAFLECRDASKVRSCLEWLWDHGGMENWKARLFDLQELSHEQLVAAVDFDRDVLPYIILLLDKPKFKSQRKEVTA
jgi:hypothetical protein